MSCGLSAFGELTKYSGKEEEVLETEGTVASTVVVNGNAVEFRTHRKEHQPLGQWV